MEIKLKKEFDLLVSKGIVPFQIPKITVVQDSKGILKKKIQGLPKSHNEITLDTCYKYQTGESMCVGTGKRSNLVVVDFDLVESYNSFIEKNPEYKACKTVKTHKGYHLYFKYWEGVPNRADSFRSYPKVDTRTDGGFVFAPPTSYTLLNGEIAEYVDQGGEIMDFPEVLKADLVDADPKKPLSKPVEPRVELNSVFMKCSREDDIAAAYKMIDDGLLDHKSSSYTDWVDVGLAMKSFGHIDLFAHFSARCPEKYNRKEAEEYWDGFKVKELTYASLIYWARESPKYDGRFESFVEKKKSKKSKKSIGNEGSEIYNAWKLEWEVHVFSCKQRNLVCHDKYKDSHIAEAKYGTQYFLNDNNFVNLANMTYLVNPKDPDSAVQCIKTWDLDSHKREYMDYNFAPYPFKMQNDYEYYNTWKDYALVDYVPKTAVNAEHCVRVYLDFMAHMSSGDPAVLDYLIQLDAHLAQFPGEKPGVCPIFNGPSGTGKGTRTILQKALFGNEYVYETSDISQVLGQFTGAISRKLVVVLDEAVAKEMFDRDGPLKSIITQPMMKIERKGKDSFEENSFVRIQITTNNENVVRVSNSDRRLFAIHGKIYKKPEYDQFPNGIFELCESKDASKCVFDYLKGLKVKYRSIQEWQYNRPITEEYKDMQIACIPLHIQFLMEHIETWASPLSKYVVKQSQLYTCYEDYSKGKSKFEITKNKFFRLIKRLESFQTIISKREGSIVHKCYEVSKAEFNAEMDRLNYRIA